MAVHDVNIYVNQFVPPPVFYVQHLLTERGSMMIYGAPGIRKSWLVKDLGFCVATGTPWLGFNTTQAKVLLINFEISSPSYHGRLVQVARNYALQDNMLFVMSPSITYFEDREDFNRIAAIVRPIAPNIIILDCMSGCYGGDENNSREMSLFIGRITELKDEHNAAVVIVHHSNKNLLATSAMDRSRGHTKLTGWVDTVIYMAKQPTGIQLQFGKTRHSLHELYNINISFEQYRWAIGHHARGNDTQQQGGTVA